MNDTASDPRIAKLPVWARRLIEGQDRRIRNLEAQVALLSEGPEDSRVRTDDFAHPDRLLGSNLNVNYYLGESRKKYHEMITVRDKPGVLEISAHYGPDQRLCISPRVSNVIEIRLVPS